MLSRRGGGFERIHLVGNFWVDAKAKEGMAFHPINDREHSQAEDRAFLACLVQSMIKHVWATHFSQDEQAQAAKDFPATQGSDHTHEHDRLPDYDGMEDQRPPSELGDDEQDQWDAEEEASTWLQGNTELDSP